MPLGTFINVAAIIVGSLIGLLLHKNIPDRIKLIVFQGLGLSTLLIGFQMAFKTDNILVVIFSILIGGIIGEAIDLDRYVERAGDFLKHKIKSRHEHFTIGFMAATLIYCVGAMAILGPMNEGLKGDRTLMYTKAMLDGFTSIALSATYGIGVIFSIIPVLLYQGSITLLSSSVQQLASTHIINQLTAVGGLMILGIGLNLLDIKKIKVTNLLPALLVVVALSFVF